MLREAPLACNHALDERQNATMQPQCVIAQPLASTASYGTYVFVRLRQCLDMRGSWQCLQDQ